MERLNFKLAVSRLQSCLKLLPTAYCPLPTIKL